MQREIQTTTKTETYVLRVDEWKAVGIKDDCMQESGD